MRAASPSAQQKPGPRNCPFAEKESDGRLLRQGRMRKFSPVCMPVLIHKESLTECARRGKLGSRKLITTSHETRSVFFPRDLRRRCAGFPAYAAGARVGLA